MFRELADAGLAVNAWMVLLHNTRLGEAYPDATVENAFGDRYVYTLCPSAPDAREYAVALCKDVTENTPVLGISVESPGFAPYSHGFHHEFALMKQNRWFDNLLGLCFCPHCLKGAKAAGIDADRLRARICEDIESWLASDFDIPDDMAEAFWLADTRTDGDLSKFPRLAMRCRDLAGERDQRSDPQGRGVRGHPFGRAADRRRLVRGQRPCRRSPKTAGIIEACFYEPTPERVRVDAWDVKRRLARQGQAPRHPAARASGPEKQGRSDRRRRGAARGRHRRRRLLQLRPCAQREPRLDRRCARRARRLGVEFKDKVVAITGAAGGIGQALCRHFGRRGRDRSRPSTRASAA